MQQLEGRVAVVTGAASGIGFALASKFAELGMKVVLADVEADALQEAAQKLEKSGAETLAVRTDVTRAEEVDALAKQTLDAFGGVHLVCNNAGVFVGGLSWEAPLEDYDWILSVNVMGVVHGVRSFVPLMLERGEEGHVVNTASMAAVTSLPYTSIYNMSKHAVLSYSESLYHELTLRGSKIGVSALCPEAIATRINESERIRPAHLKPSADVVRGDEHEMVRTAISEQIKKGVPPAWIADRVVESVRENRFYILSDDEWKRACETRLDDIRLLRNPTFAPPVNA